MNRRELIRVSLAVGMAHAAVPASPGEGADAMGLRTLPQHEEALALLRSGELGPVRLVRAFARTVPARPVPELEPLGEWGAYWLQQVLLVGGEDAPARVIAAGAAARPAASAGGRIAGTEVALTFQLPTLAVILEPRWETTEDAQPACWFYGSGGTLRLGADGWSVQTGGSPRSVEAQPGSAILTGPEWFLADAATRRLARLARRSLRAETKLDGRAWHGAAG